MFTALEQVRQEVAKEKEQKGIALKEQAYRLRAAEFAKMSMKEIDAVLAAVITAAGLDLTDEELRDVIRYEVAQQQAKEMARYKAATNPDRPLYL
jgi:isopentenyldiphosphate isomerase